MERKMRGVKKAKEILDALTHPSRLAIVEYLDKYPESCTTELCCDTVVGYMNSGTFNYHTKILINLGLVEKVRRGCYSLSDNGEKVYEIIKDIIENPDTGP